VITRGVLSVYVTDRSPSPIATIAMEDIEKALGPVVGNLSDENYAESLVFYRFWIDIGRTYHKISPDLVFDTIWKNRTTDSIVSKQGKLIHSSAHLVLRLAGDVESGHILTPDSGSGLQSRLSTRALQDFFANNLRAVRRESESIERFYAEANLVARSANLGHVEEVAIRDHILQSLIIVISHPKNLYDHQADGLIILFKLAGATFEAYADPSVVDRCFELLTNHSYDPPWSSPYQSANDIYFRERKELIQVCAPGKGWRVTIELRHFQEVVALRGRGWEGLPPPPSFASGRLKLVGGNQEDPTATPVATLLGLPSGDPEPQVTQPSPSEFVAAPETGVGHGESPATSIAQSPSISIATLSDFTIADGSDDESSIEPTFANTSDEGLLVDPTAIVPHETFHLDDGNVEVLCGNTLFRVHASTLSFHSPALRRMFAQTSLVTAESSNGCPRILSSDAATDFVTLLNIVYLPEYATRPIPTDCSTNHLLSAGSPNGIACRISPHSRPSSESRQSTRWSPSDLGYSVSSTRRIRRLLRVFLLPNLSERESSPARLLTQTRSSTCSFSRSSRLHYRWRTTWRLERD